MDRMLDKKAMAEAALWIIRILILVAIVAAVHFVQIMALNNALQSYDTEFYILNTKILYSPTGLAYQSLVSGRAYPGIIELEEFNEANLNSSMTRNIPTKLRLMNLDKSLIKELYYDKEGYNLLEPLAFSKQYDTINKTYYVLINDKGENKQGLLNVEMVVSR